MEILVLESKWTVLMGRLERRKKTKLDKGIKVKELNNHIKNQEHEIYEEFKILKEVTSTA